MSWKRVAGFARRSLGRAGDNESDVHKQRDISLFLVARPKPYLAISATGGSRVLPLLPLNVFMFFYWRVVESIFIKRNDEKNCSRSTFTTAVLFEFVTGNFEGLDFPCHAFEVYLPCLQFAQLIRLNKFKTPCIMHSILSNSSWTDVRGSE